MTANMLFDLPAAADSDNYGPLFTGEAYSPAPRHQHTGRQGQAGQAAMLCARCWNAAGPFVAHRDGIALCVDCAREYK